MPEKPRKVTPQATGMPKPAAQPTPAPDPKVQPMPEAAPAAAKAAPAPKKASEPDARMDDIKGLSRDDSGAFTYRQYAQKRGINSSAAFDELIDMETGGKLVNMGNNTYKEAE